MTAEECYDKAEAIALRSGLVGFHGWGMLIDDIAKAIAEAEAAARAERDMEWWTAVVLVDNVKPSPEAAKDWLMCLSQYTQDHTRAEERERCAAQLEADAERWERVTTESLTYRWDAAARMRSYAALLRQHAAAIRSAGEPDTANRGKG